MMQDGVNLLGQHGVDGGDVTVEGATQPNRIVQESAGAFGPEPILDCSGVLAAQERRESLGQGKIVPADKSPGQYLRPHRDGRRFNRLG
jgi:hypothetical protein